MLACRSEHLPRYDPKAYEAVYASPARQATSPLRSLPNPAGDMDTDAFVASIRGHGTTLRNTSTSMPATRDQLSTDSDPIAAWARDLQISAVPDRPTISEVPRAELPAPPALHRIVGHCVR
jgi:hypothetical protein